MTKSTKSLDQKSAGVQMKILAVFKTLLKVFSVLFAIFISYAVYGMYAEKTARKDAQAFCNTVTIGGSVNDLLSRAIASGAEVEPTKWHKVDGQPDWLPVTFIGLPPFSRYYCSINAVGGKVTKAEPRHMD